MHSHPDRLIVRAPHDRSRITEIEVDDESSVKGKIQAALSAGREWEAKSPSYRSEALLRIAEATESERNQLAEELSREQGKTVREAHLELDRYIGPFRQYAGLATLPTGKQIALGDGIVGVVDRVPVGLVAGLVPWNFPASLTATKVAPALAAGCSFLIKPAESTSLITRRLAGIASQFLPSGLLDVVVGGAEAGTQLVSDPDVAKVAFTGSTAVGRRVASEAGRGLKIVSLELGGCDPVVVFEDADLARAVRAIMGTRFYNAGQVCVAPKRLIVHESIADDVIERLAERLGRVVLGPGTEEGSTMGPLHTEEGREHLEAQVSDARDAGAAVIGGGRPSDPTLENGSFFLPALLVDVPARARVRREETFGPVLSVLKFRGEDEAVRVANETPFALGASVWSGDGNRAAAVARRITAGYTWVNSLARVYDELPFGGVKASGFGREHGVEAYESYFEDHAYVIGHS